MALQVSSSVSLGQVARSVRDIAQSIQWYQERLGLPLLETFPGMAFFGLGGPRLYLQQDPEAGPESILYFVVDDIEASHVALAARGITFIRPPHMIHRHADGTEEWLAFFADPEERPLALMARRRP